MSVIKTTWFDTEDGGAVVVREQQVGEIAEWCRARQNQGMWSDQDGNKHAARLPNTVIEHYCTVHGINLAEFVRNPEHVKRLCEDPNFADFRIWPGKL